MTLIYINGKPKRKTKQNKQRKEKAMYIGNSASWTKKDFQLCVWWDWERLIKVAPKVSLQEKIPKN